MCSYLGLSQKYGSPVLQSRSPGYLKLLDILNKLDASLNVDLCQYRTNVILLRIIILNFFLVPRSSSFNRAVTKSGTGTWGLGRGTRVWDVGRVGWDVGTWGRGDVGMRKRRWQELIYTD